MRVRFFQACGVALSLLSSFAPTVGQAQDKGKPNLLIFYSDDQGWGETGCYGDREIPEDVTKLQAMWDQWNAQQAAPSAIDVPKNPRPGNRRGNQRPAPEQKSEHD